MRLVKYIIVLLVAGCAWLLAEVPPIFAPIVMINAEMKENNWDGTGFFAYPNVVFTAAHVLTREREVEIAPDLADVVLEPVPVGDDVEIILLNNKRKLRGFVLYRNSQADIAAIMVRKFRFPAPLKISFRRPLLGEKVTVMGVFKGEPFLVESKVTTIAKVGWSDLVSPEVEQETVYFAPAGMAGTSGSPVLDTEGYVWGINVGANKFGHGIATPFWKVEKEIRELERIFKLRRTESQ